MAKTTGMNGAVARTLIYATGRCVSDRPLFGKETGPARASLLRLLGIAPT
jgi:hypothetical protein